MMFAEQLKMESYVLVCCMDMEILKNCKKQARRLSSNGRKNYAPFADKGIQLAGGIGRAGGWKADSTPTGGRLNITMIHFPGLFSIAIDRLDRSGMKDWRKIVGNHIPDGRIGGSDDGALSDRVPCGDSVPEQKGMPFRNRHRNLFMIQCSQYFPEPVLGMSIEVHHFPGFDRWKTPEDQNAGVFIIGGRYGMYDAGTFLVCHVG